MAYNYFCFNEKGVKDIFTECSKEDDHAIKAQLKAGFSDRLVNLENFNDKTIDEHFGGTVGNDTTTAVSNTHMTLPTNREV